MTGAPRINRPLPLRPTAAPGSARPGRGRAFVARAGARAVLWGVALALAGCVTRSVEVVATPASPEEFATWSCARIDDETERVQKRAADVAYSVDQRAGTNIVAMSVGLSVFWPALLAMRPDGLEASELSRLKGRHDALRVASQRAACPPARAELPPERAAALPVAVGDRLVYSERSGQTGATHEAALLLVALRRGEVEYTPLGGADAALRHDASGNVVAAPAGGLMWPHLLRGELELGHIVAGDLTVQGDPLARARMRGQVVAVGPQMLAGRRFDVAVIELYGDAQRGEAYTRVDGALVVDRRIGVLLRLDLRSAQPPFNLQRRLARIETSR